SRRGCVGQSASFTKNSARISSLSWPPRLAILRHTSARIVAVSLEALREKIDRLFLLFFDGDGSVGQYLIRKMRRPDHFRKRRVLRQDMKNIGILRQIAEDMRMESHN